ncbi:MAG: tetratricopeptide repeat protein [Bryobacteraceae bacterium]|nr:tetratricopeptide repeat protein [Bryobacteraceae bacterium]MDW8376902.1 tetratricopeptide repeat protein [Bryobacterales bacterium]
MTRLNFTQTMLRALQSGTVVTLLACAQPGSPPAAGPARAMASPPSAAALAVAECQKHRHYGRRQEARACYTQLSSRRDPYLMAEGLWGLGFYQDANSAFRQAVALHPKSAELRTRWGRLFLERYNGAEAEKLFREALELQPDYAPALVGLALAASEHFDAKAREFAEQALKLDPNNIEAQEVLARLALEDINFDKARQEAEKALQMNRDSLNAMAVLGVLEILEDKPQTWLRRMDQVNPVYAPGYHFVGHQLQLNRRYSEAIEYLKEALKRDPDYWAAHSELGITYMRLGLEEQARRHLELAHNNGWRDAATTNSLRLIDSYKNFVTVPGERCEVRLDKKEAALLKLYVVPELEKAIATYEKKYKVKLAEKVKLELYPNHEDFAVRTLGLPGLGALGVTFGTVVAMDSPSGRPPGSFHWASTLWHELSHVFVLTATKHRVPRWFTEGLAVYEETAVAPDWGDRLDPTVLGAVRDKKLLPVSSLDRGFIRPTYPSQVIVSYFQAGRICDYIAQKWGFQKLLDMMHQFAQNVSTPRVIETQLQMKPEAFDQAFLGWLEQQLATPLARFGDWTKRLRQLAQAAREKRHDDVIQQGLEIRDWFPDYVEAGNVYEFLADAFIAKGDRKSALAELERYAKVGGRNPESLKRLAALYEEHSQPKNAMATLEKLNYIYPVADPEMHRKYGELSLEHGSVNVAIREFQAVLASKPVDLAQAHYNLARAYRKANRMEEALDQVLLALEAAPGYRPAQKLLLELNSKQKAN